MTCADFASDLTARALAVGGTGQEEASALDAHLAGCAPCRDELERLRRVTGAAAEADALRAAAAPPPALLGTLLATVRDEARERRHDAALEARAAALAAAAPTSSADCGRLREEIPALVLGHLDAAEAARVTAHLAACAPCDAERAVFGRLLAAQRAAPRTAVPADGLTRLLGAVRAETASAGASADDESGGSHRLRSVPGRRRPRWFRLAFSAVAAAAVIAAILLAPNAGGGARVCCDAGLILRPQPVAGTSAAPRHIGRDAGAFPFREGDELETTSEPAVVKLAIAAAPGDGEAAADGELVISLAPSTRVSRSAADAIELRAGAIGIRAGHLAAPFRITHGDLYASIVGTELDVDLLPGAEPRLLVLVRSGSVEVGRGGATPITIGPGRAAVVGTDVLRDVAAGGLSARDAILAPKLVLVSAKDRVWSDAPLEFVARFETRLPTPVTIAAIDGNEPRLLLGLSRGGGREREVKIQRSMIVDGAADRPSVRVVPGRPTEMRLRIDGLTLEPGVWEARLRYHAMNASTDGTGRPADPSGALGIEWSGAVESRPVQFEIVPKQMR